MEISMAAIKWGPIKVEDVMHRDIRWTDPDMCLAEAAKKMRDLNVGSLPVWEDDELVGIITDRDIICRAVAEVQDPSTVTIRDFMSKDVAFCFDDQDVRDAARIMQKRKVSRLPVLDRDKHMVGMLTLRDISIKFPELAARIVLSASPPH